ncbi:MAG: S8 family peptidase [Actinomycetota bacterium]
MKRLCARPVKIEKLLMTAAIAGFATILAFMPVASVYGHERTSDAIIVKYKAGVLPAQSQAINKKHGLKTEATIGRLGAQAVDITDIMPLELKIQELKLDPAVEYAEPDYRRSVSITSPNDTYYYSYQWNMPKTRTDYAWDIQRGSSGVVIAIVDTGVSLTHPDFAGKLVAGYDFVAGDPDPTDENGHGTHVAGIAAANTNNGIGVAGMSWYSRIMPMRVLDASGNGYDSDIANGITWAADHGAKVINMSLGGPSSYPQTLQNAVNYAYARGVTIVAASGNNPTGEITYPAACSNVIGVAATDSTDNRASFSNYGSFVDVAAPGVSIASTYWSAGANTYGTGSGTSMASPHVAGLASLVLAQYPSATLDQVEAAIETTAVDLGTPGPDNYYGYGRIDSYAALNYSGFAVDHFTVQAGSPQTAGSSFSVTVTARDPAGAVKTGFAGLASLTDISGTISPVQTGNFTAGVWTGNVTITKSGATAITASYGYPPRTGTSSTITINPAALNHLSIAPVSVAVQPGQTQAFTASAYDVYNNPISGQILNWSPAGGTVNPATGVGTTYTAGSTRGSFLLTASASGYSATATVVVGLIGAHPNGMLVKVAGAPAVYFLEMGLKRPIGSATAFNAFGLRWDRVIEISQSELNSYPDGLALGCRPGTLIKTPSKPDVYVTDYDYVNLHYIARPIVSAQVFSQVGLGWSDILLVTDSELASGYTIEDPLVNATPKPEGCLIKVAGAPDVYIMEKGLRRPISSAIAFISNALNWGKIIVIGQTEMNGYPVGPVLNTRPGAVIKDDEPTVFVSDYDPATGTTYKRTVVSAQKFTAYGLRWEDIVVVTPSEIHDLFDWPPIE